MVPIWMRGAADTQEFCTQSRGNWPRPPPKSPRRAFFFSPPAGRMEEWGSGGNLVQRHLPFPGKTLVLCREARPQRGCRSLKAAFSEISPGTSQTSSRESSSKLPQPSHGGTPERSPQVKLSATDLGNSPPPPQQASGRIGTEKDPAVAGGGYFPPPSRETTQPSESWAQRKGCKSPRIQGSRGRESNRVEPRI